MSCSSDDPFFYLRKGNIFAVPVIHYNMETAAQVKMAYEQIKPDCVAVELAETMQLQLLHAASRLPDISVVVSYDSTLKPLYYLVEPCDGAFEALRSALEKGVPAFCIDLDLNEYPQTREVVPDPYAIHKIGLKSYFDTYQKISETTANRLSEDRIRELYMAKRLKELSLSYDKILFVGGMYHVQRVLDLTEKSYFPPLAHAHRDVVDVCTLTPEACREVMSEYGWIALHYELQRHQFSGSFSPDRQMLIYQLYKAAAESYKTNTGHRFPNYNFRNLMKFVRNYALINSQLMPDLYQILTAAKGCVDHNYAYEVWELATNYPFFKNVDSLHELDLTTEEVWGHSKLIRFHMREKGRKDSAFQHRRQKQSRIQFHPPSPFSICSYPKEDLVIERFGNFLKKKGTQILSEDSSRTIPFSSSIEDGVDVKETIRHLYEKKLYVKVKGKPSGNVGSIVMIFDEDAPEEGGIYEEKYPWKTTWIGEHSQESDMALYSTSLRNQVVGPGISRCQYGGFMMSYPPRRLFDIWTDPDYAECRTKSEVLLVAAIDYSLQPLIVYVAAKPPRSQIKSFARRFGKKIVYIPIGQLSPVLLNKIRIFHVLDGHDKRAIADEYIF
jgi:hypothetical protein